MNIQTERLANHSARLTVEIDENRLEQAKKTAARKLSNQVNIPGFRRGKAPYRILVNHVGEGAILESALDDLGSEIYKESLEQSDLEPFGPGSLDDFTIDPAPTFTFTIPLQPTVELGDYRSIRREFVSPEIEDKAVDLALRHLQEQHALVEESHQPVMMGNRVTIDIHSEFQDGSSAPEDTDEELDEDADGSVEGEDEASHPHAEGYIHEHDAQIILDSENEALLPGFSSALVAANVDDDVEFELTVPDDEEEYADAAGRPAKFFVTIKKVENITLPVLNDDFAARVTENEETPLTLLELRMRVRESLQEEALRKAESEFSSGVLDEIVEQATISFPDELIAQQIEMMLNDLDSNLRRQGITLDDYMRITETDRDTLSERYRDPGVRSIKRSLALYEIIKAEDIDVTDTVINERIDDMVSQFGDQAEAFRAAFDTPAIRDNMRDEMVQELAQKRIAAIAKGEAEAPDVEEESATEDQTIDPDESVVAEEVDNLE